jgi:hypothetical protein
VSAPQSWILRHDLEVDETDTQPASFAEAIFAGLNAQYRRKSSGWLPRIVHGMPQYVMVCDHKCVGL